MFQKKTESQLFGFILNPKSAWFDCTKVPERGKKEYSESQRASLFGSRVSLMSIWLVLSKIVWQSLIVKKNNKKAGRLAVSTLILFLLETQTHTPTRTELAYVLIESESRLVH